MKKTLVYMYLCAVLAGAAATVPVYAQSDTVSTPVPADTSAAQDTGTVAPRSAVAQRDTGAVDTSIVDTSAAPASAPHDNTTDTSAAETVQGDTVKADTAAARPRTRITIDTDPGGAVVEVDDSTYGTTPVQLRDLAPGEYALTFKKAGHFMKKARLQVKEGMQRSFTVTLTKPATVIVQTEPSDADVFLNGRRMGTSPYKNRTLKPGTYTLEVKKQGYVPQRKELELASGERIQTEVALVAADTADTEALQPEDAPDSVKTAAASSAETGADNMQTRALVLSAFAVFTVAILLVEYLGP